MIERCDRCRKKFEWSLEANVFCVDIGLEKMSLCEDCKNDLKEWIKSIREKKELEEEHEDKAYTSEPCCLCGEIIKGFGNNALPLEDGRCCEDCNLKKVIPAGLKLHGIIPK